MLALPHHSLIRFQDIQFMFFALACAFEIHSQPMPRTYREAMRRPDWRHYRNRGRHRHHYGLAHISTGYQFRVSKWHNRQRNIDADPRRVVPGSEGSWKGSQTPCVPLRMPTGRSHLVGCLVCFLNKQRVLQQLH